MNVPHLFQSTEKTYLFCAILDKSETSWLPAFRATGVPQEVLGHDLSIRRKHFEQSRSGRWWKQRKTI